MVIGRANRQKFGQGGFGALFVAAVRAPILFS
jgi:hypothetical protein